MRNSTKAAALLGLLTLAGCRSPQEAPRDYDGVRRRAGEAHSAHHAEESNQK